MKNKLNIIEITTYLINFINNDNKINTVFYLLDSNSYINNNFNNYDFVHENQIEWYKEKVTEIWKNIPSMMFLHIPLPETKEAIEKYLDNRINLPKSNPEYNALFLSTRNKRLSKRRVQDIIKTELNTLLDNKSQGYHTHTLRHTSATLLYNENDIDIRIIKEMLGHSSLASTEIYTQVSNKKLKEFMQNFSILDIEKEKEK